MITFYDRIVDMRGNLLTVYARDVGLGELAIVYKRDGSFTWATVLQIDHEKVTLQVFSDLRGVATNDRISFLGKPMEVQWGPSLLGRRFSGVGRPLDDGPAMVGEALPLTATTFNPVRRAVPEHQVLTGLPMIDVFNCLLTSQKIPIFSVAGEPYNALLMSIANQTNASVVVIGGMGLRFDDYQLFVDNMAVANALTKTVMFVHQATDPVIECLFVPDISLAVAEKFAAQGHNVLVLLTDMTAYADSLKEVAIAMDQIPANRGYPGALYSELALRYEKAVSIAGSGSITIISVTTMPGGDVTHPVPDNTGYITEGQFFLADGCIDPFKSLSRLKSYALKKSREDHGDLANALVRLYADSMKAKERESMGFKPTVWDKKLLAFGAAFKKEIMPISVQIPLLQALDKGWELLGRFFEPHEVGIKQQLVDQFWRKLPVA